MESEKKDEDLSESVSALDHAVAELKTQDVRHALQSLLQANLKHVYLTLMQDLENRLRYTMDQRDRDSRARPRPRSSSPGAEKG